MTAAPAIKGWCPTLLSPMQSGDGWLARVKPAAGVLSAKAARLIAASARRHGNGHIDLTSRANIQIRGLTRRSAEVLAESIVGASLANATPAVEAIRNVMASPLGPDDPSAAFDSHALAHELETMLAEEPALTALPAKFGILVDGGGILPLAGITADIMVRATGEALSVQLDGGVLLAPCSPSTLAETVKALAFAFIKLAAARRERPRRMRELVQTAGEKVIFAAARLTPVPMPEVATPHARSPVGFVSYPDRAQGSFGAGLPFGRIEADMLARLADLSERFGDGTLRTTPWRILLLPGIAATDAGDLAHAVEALGLIADAGDPRLYILACVGAPACQSASVDARGDASRLAAAVALPPDDRTVHVSGCVKSCAHQGPTALTLIGRDGRYDLVRNGHAGDKPALTGLDIDQVIALLGAAMGQRP